jgi:SAM-dependent methyltransferase
MHKEAKEFTEFAKQLFPSYFEEKTVLDVGSGDINGNNRYLFNKCSYFANDVIEAPNVNIVCKTKDLPFSKDTMDTIISTECFEHDPEYKASLKKIVSILKPGGLFLSLTPAFPSPKAFQDPTHVNFIREETFSEYFCRPNLWAEMYGFKGEFELVMQVWEDGKLRSLLRAMK